METLYEYLLDNYKENEPIFLADLQIDGMTRTNVRQQVKKLADTGKVRRFDNGIYFCPKRHFSSLVHSSHLKRYWCVSI